MSRTKKTAINSITGLICTIVSSVLSFVLRAMFIRLLGLEYAGVNSLFSDILKILNLVDLGFSNAVMYRLYKTIADGDNASTEMYLALYRKICYVVGTIVAVGGLCCIPFLDSLVKETPNFKEPLWSLYIIVLTTSVTSHFVNYKGILLVAKQDRYISTIIQYSCIFLRHGLQIIVLAVFKNIYLYLVVPLFTTVLMGILKGAFTKKKYGLSWNSSKKVDPEERKKIVKDVGALSAYKLCRTLDATVDTFLISKFVAVATTAIYGSISMLLSALEELLSVFNDGMIASIGDLNASEGGDRLETVFYESYHFTFLIYGICTAALVPFISVFSQWWIGHTLDANCIYLMLLNFFMYGFGMNVATFRNAMGIFRKGWIRPAFTALFNLLFSLLFVKKLGLIGTLIGTLLARVCTLVWFDPWLVLHYGMKKSPIRYYTRYIVYTLIVLLASIAAKFVCSFLPTPTSFLPIVFRGIVSFFVSAAVIFPLGFAMPEHKSVINRGKNIFIFRLKKGTV